MTAAAIKQGDFTGLARHYAQFRPGYSEDVLSAILGIAGKAPRAMSVADVGAGTGIWTRMLAARDFASVTAVEPNDDMRGEGEAGSAGLPIRWQKGSGEATGLAAKSADLITMASSFHWVDFDEGTKEFHRVLKSGGLFACLWNPRYLDDSPMLLEIEAKLAQMNPDMKRKSSGRSAFVEELTARFGAHPLFESPVYLEGRHTARLSQEQYVGVWNSVNDIRAQLGEAGFAAFMDFIKARIADCAYIDCTYLTRAWVVRAKG